MILFITIPAPHGFAFEFETCDPTNHYLETRLQEPAPSQCIQNTRIFPETPDPDALSQSDSEIACIGKAMSRFSKSGSGYAYKKCSSTKAIPAKVDRPCISENYVRYIYDRFKSVSRCVLKDSSIRLKETFPLFALESGFHLNVTSGSGCRGIGQLSRIAVQEMDDVDQADMEKCDLPFSKCSLFTHPECTPFEKHLTGPIPDHSEKLGECEVIAIPENPDSNLLYSLRLYRMLKDDKASTTIEKNLPRLKAMGLGPEEVEELKTRLAQAMYNGGYPSIQSTFNAFLRTLPPKAFAKGQKGEILWSRYKTHLYNHYPAKGAARRQEVRDSVNKIEKAKSQIEESTGAACF